MTDATVEDHSRTSKKIFLCRSIARVTALRVQETPNISTSRLVQWVTAAADPTRVTAQQNATSCDIQLKQKVKEKVEDLKSYTSCGLAGTKGKCNEGRSNNIKQDGFIPEPTPTYVCFSFKLLCLKVEVEALHFRLVQLTMPSLSKNQPNKLNQLNQLKPVRSAKQSIAVLAVLDRLDH